MGLRTGSPASAATPPPRTPKGRGLSRAEAVYEAAPDTVFAPGGGITLHGGADPMITQLGAFGPKPYGPTQTLDTDWSDSLSAKSPYVGLGEDDRARLQGALQDVDQRFQQNIADIDMQEQLLDPRRQEIQEAQIAHALRAGGRLGGEDDLADLQLGTAIERAGPGEDGYTFGETLAQMPEKQQKAFERAQMQERHAMIMGVVKQIQGVMDEATAEHDQHPGEGWSPAMRQMLAPLMQMLNTFMGVSTPGAMWAQAGETEAEGYANQNPNAPAQNPAQR